MSLSLLKFFWLVTFGLLLVYGQNKTSPPPGIEVAISVDWEGFGGRQKPWATEDGRISDTIYQDFLRVREELPKTSEGLPPPFIQLLGPGFFTQKEFNPQKVATQIKSLLRKGDEFGLHIHAYKSLIDYTRKFVQESEATPLPEGFLNSKKSSHMSFYDSPIESADWDRDFDREGDYRDPNISGYGNPLFNFSVEELRAMIRASRNLFRKYGISESFEGQDPSIFRASAGLYSKTVYAALMAEGIRKDTSAIPLHWFGVENPRMDVSSESLWTSLSLLVSSTTRAYYPDGEYTEKTTSAGLVQGARLSEELQLRDKPIHKEIYDRSLTLYPINGSMADFYARYIPMKGTGPEAESQRANAIAKEMFQQYKKIVQVYLRDPTRVHYLQFGIHFDFYPVFHRALTIALNQIFEDAKQNNIPLRYATLPLPTNL